MEFLGQGSGLSHSCDLSISLSNANEDSPICCAEGGLNLSPTVAQMPIPLRHSGNSRIC